MDRRRLIMRVGTRLHAVVLALSGGRLGRRIVGMRVVEVETLGRTSGLWRRVVLTIPVTVPSATGDGLVVVASRGGDPHPPAWYLNMQADPAVRVIEPGQPSRPYRARAVDADERARLWPRVVAAYAGYAGYQERTTREIPLVVLEPDDDVARSAEV